MSGNYKEKDSSFDAPFNTSPRRHDQLSSVSDFDQSQNTLITYNRIEDELEFHFRDEK